MLPWKTETGIAGLLSLGDNYPWCQGGEVGVKDAERTIAGYDDLNASLPAPAPTCAGCGAAITDLLPCVARMVK